MFFFGWYLNQEKKDIHLEIYVGRRPLPVTVTTRIITCLIGNPYNHSFTTVTVRGPYPRYMPCIGSKTTNQPTNK